MSSSIYTNVPEQFNWRKNYLIIEGNVSRALLRFVRENMIGQQARLRFLRSYMNDRVCVAGREQVIVDGQLNRLAIGYSTEITMIRIQENYDEDTEVRQPFRVQVRV